MTTRIEREEKVRKQYKTCINMDLPKSAKKLMDQYGGTYLKDLTNYQKEGTS